MPTLIDMLELELSEDEAAVISKLPGRSFLPSLYGNEYNDQRPVIIFSEYGPTRMIRTRSFKYVQVQDHGEDLFFDLEKDPREQNNLISSPSYATTIKEMQKQLDSWFAEYADSCYDKFRLLSQGRGQVDTYESNSPNPFIQDESNGRNYLEVANQKREDMLRMIRDRQGNTR